MDITGPIRQDGPIDHIVKKSCTPTMGGYNHNYWHANGHVALGRFE